MKTATFALVFAILTLLLLFMPLQSYSLVSAKVISSGMEANQGFVAVYGEVFNDGNKPLKMVSVTVFFYDSGNKIVGAESDLIALGTLMPKSRSPFVLAFPTGDKQVSDYGVMITNLEVSDPKEVGLSLVSHTSTLQQGIMTITGKVKNDSSQPSIATVVHASFYDSGGRMVGTAFGGTTPVDILPGREADFKIIPETKAPGASDYYQIAESQKYLSGAVESKPRSAGEAPTQPPLQSQPPTSLPTQPAQNITGRLTLSNISVVDQQGSPLSSISAGQQIIISNKIQNGKNAEQNFAYIVQIKDKDGFTVMVSWVQGSLVPSQSFDLGISWVPDTAGEYSAEVFVWEGIANPVPLTGIKTAQLTVK